MSILSLVKDIAEKAEDLEEGVSVVIEPAPEDSLLELTTTKVLSVAVGAAVVAVGSAIAAVWWSRKTSKKSEALEDALETTIEETRASAERAEKAAKEAGGKTA